MCVRFYKNSPLVRPDLEIRQITIDKFKQYFPPDILHPVAKIMFCGVHGDPCIARDTLEICEYLLENTSMKCAIQIHTNGGMRNTEWWTKLGKIFSNRNQLNWDCWRVIFSIDGLKDTNHLYRRNVEWDKLTANAQAFIDAGGNAAWEYLIFKHNEHQIEEAEELSKKMGFKMFIPKKALGVAYGDKLKPLPAVNKEGKLEYIIEAPTLAKHRNVEHPTGTLETTYQEFKVEDYRKLKISKSNENYQDKVNIVYDQLKSYSWEKLDNCEIKCKAGKDWGAKEIFIDSDGKILPCCYIGTQLNGTHTDLKSLQLHKHINDYGWDNFDLNKHTIKEIIDAGHLDRVFADSWTKDSVRSGKMAYCSEICGEESRIDRVYFKK
jgi:MoaA/NifB/PqqE/SkfB family radical SAM enzyme